MRISAGSKSVGRSYLDGQCLIAMPGMRDERFQRTVIYVCAHSDEGAMGLIINQAAADVCFSEILLQLGIVESENVIRLKPALDPVPVLRGGPVETGRGFVLHSADYFVDESTLPIDEGVCLTHTVDILKAMAAGEGPSKAFLALGYAGWGAGQLESEIQANGWLHCAADPGLLFDLGHEARYAGALSKLGVDPGRLSAAAGHG